jgi:hypothetical protein
MGALLSPQSAPVPDGSITTAKLGGDITAAGEALLVDATAADQRDTLGLAEIAATGSGADLVEGSTPVEALVDIDTMTLLGNGEGSSGPVQVLEVGSVQGMIGFPVGCSLQILKKTADTVFASATPADVPVGASGAALAFSVVSGRTYYFRFVCLVRSDTQTVGPALSVTVPAATRFGAKGVLVGTAADGVDGAYEGAITASDDAVAVGNVAAVDTDYIFALEGILIPSANGSLTLRARTETGTTNVTVRQGTIGMLWDLGT